MWPGKRIAALLVAAGCFLLSDRHAVAAVPPSPDQVTDDDRAFLVALFNYQAAAHYRDSPDIHITLLKSWEGDWLLRIRRTCAMNAMGTVIDAVAAQSNQVAAHGVKSTPMPDVASYCLATIGEAKRRGSLSNLYINLALQEQGKGSLGSLEGAQLLKNNEAWRTTEAILRAANDGQVAYTSITGKLRVLPCSLALDAGYTWASGNAKAQSPVALTQAEADDAKRQCYDPATIEIKLNGTAYPSAKAGVILGAWLALHQPRAGKQP